MIIMHQSTYYTLNYIIDSGLPTIQNVHYMICSPYHITLDRRYVFYLMVKFAYCVHNYMYYKLVAMSYLCYCTATHIHTYVLTYLKITVLNVVKASFEYNYKASLKLKTYYIIHSCICI